MSHAILSPSGASRWLACTKSARLEQQFPDRAGEAASEGTLAHAVAEWLLHEKLNTRTEAEQDRIVAELKANTLYSDSMFSYMEDYVTFVIEQYAEAQEHTIDAIIFLEQRLDLTEYVPEGFGTGDVVIIADHTMYIIDLKYGKGVQVNAENNKQMMLYSLGALRAFECLYNIETIRMTIHQPRIDNYSTWEMRREDLLTWAEEELKPRAALAFAGEGEFHVGDHCRFCRAKAVCRAHADYNLELAKYEFANAETLDDVEIADVLGRADLFNKWITSVEAHALHEAVNNGKHWPGYKLVEGRSNRTYTDDVAVGKKLLKDGYKDDQIYTKKLIGITAMEKLLTKPVFNNKLGDLVAKPPGKPALVPETDKRPAYHSTDAAKLAFADVVDDFDE